jgi:hypothetical protein
MDNEFMLLSNFEFEFAQMKLVSGHEIVCEVIEWPDEDDFEIVSRNVLSVILVDHDGERKYTFRPFLQYCESQSDLVILNINHVMSINRPNFLLINDYKLAIKQMHEIMNARFDIFEKERKKEAVKKHTGDSDEPRIIQFPVKNLH